MHSLKNFLGFVALASLTTLAACDQSKPALDKATADLAAMTTERDGLKAQLAASNNQIVALRGQVADLQGKLAAATAPAPAPAAVEEKKPEPAAKKGKKSAKP
jgi:predicted  nucleic acid-binding Zn-ribbon protein